MPNDNQKHCLLDVIRMMFARTSQGQTLNQQACQLCRVMSGRVKCRVQPGYPEAEACRLQLEEEPYPQLLSFLDKSGCHLHIVSKTRCQNALCYFIGDNASLDHALPDTISLIL